MTRRLLDQDIAVIAWDRDAEHVRALEGSGGEPAEQPSEVVSGTGVVITMLPTADVILDVVEPLLDDWPDGTIWLQMSSVGAAEADQLTQVAAAHAVRLVDAPVSGSTHPAEEGELTILASGPDSARAAVQPVFDALARCSGTAKRHLLVASAALVSTRTAHVIGAPGTPNYRRAAWAWRCRLHAGFARRASTLGPLVRLGCRPISAVRQRDSARSL